MATDAASLAIYGTLMLITTLAAWKGVWHRHAHPPTRGGAVLGTVGFMLIAAIPAAIVLPALDTGHMPCLGRLCHGSPGYDLADAPGTFWTYAVLLGLLSAFFLGGVLFGLSWLLQSIRPRGG